MTRHIARFLPALLLGMVAHAATISFTLTVTNATVTISGSSASLSGPATLSLGGGAPDSGTFSSSGSLADINGSNITVPFTLKFADGTVTGTMTFPASALITAGPAGGGSASITGGTGIYAGYTGSSTTATGSSSASLLGNQTISFTISGTVTTSGSTGGGSTAPTITAVLDAGSYTANIAEGSIFVVKGTNLSPSGYNPFGFPLPQSSGGVFITFTPVSGGSGTNAYLIYTYNQSGVNQLAAILPSTLAAGNYSVTVTNGSSTSAPFAATVVKSKVGIFTQDSSGSGLAVVQNYVSASEIDIDRFTTGAVSGVAISPAKPGQVLIAWGTGMGPVSFADNTGSPGYDFTKNGVSVQAIVGGVSIPVAFAGRTATLAGEDEIVFTLPANVPTGCTVPFQVSVNGVLSAPTFISIAPSTSPAACVQPGFTTAQLTNFDQGGTMTAGAFNLTQIQESVPSYGNVKIDSVGGAFAQFTGFQLASAAQYAVTTSISGACQVINVSGSGSSLISGSVTGLDAGALSLSGPGGSSITNLALTEDSTSHGYSLTLAEEGIPGAPSASLVAGTYTLSGTGGKDVGSFKVSISLGTPLNLSPALPSTVSRNAGLPLSWTGGNTTDVVEIIGYSGTSTTSGTTTTTNATEFICTTTAGTGGFTVPASVLAQLPATAASTSGGAGFLEVSSGPTPSPFSPLLTAGGSVSSTFAALIGSGALVTYQ